MSLPVISFEAGERHLTWHGVLDAIAKGHERPRAEIGDTFLHQGDRTLLSRAAWIAGLGAAVKTATVVPENAAAGKPVINGGLCLYSDVDGTLEALVDFHLVTKWKTAGDSLLAARRLARDDSRNILLVGAGTVARSLVDGYRALFPGAAIRIWSRTGDSARALANETAAEVAASLEDAVREADIISTATMSQTPLIRGDWLRPGQHLDLIGAYKSDMREADDTAIARGRLFVDSRETTVHHIGELMIPLENNVISEFDVLADFYEPAKMVRDGPDDLTIFKNGGGAHMDLMVARHVLEVWRDGGEAT
ncbi:ornithine cyclodeaminase family protein [Aestuariibius sp. 2305UL40-4]|uniref:ornithine cyclodeaminase family protein n=1 Tax=Aestuariibius violaceus TaxID=3234132 RepID=UPI00345E6DD0